MELIVCRNNNSSQMHKSQEQHLIAHFSFNLTTIKLETKFNRTIHMQVNHMPIIWNVNSIFCFFYSSYIVFNVAVLI